MSDEEEAWAARERAIAEVAAATGRTIEAVHELLDTVDELFPEDEADRKPRTAPTNAGMMWMHPGARPANPEE